MWHTSASVDIRQSWLNEWWNEARWEKNKTASWEKKENEKGEKHTHYECQAKSQESAPFHTIAISIPQRRKSREKRKVTLQWAWNYWFHRARKASTTFLSPDNFRAWSLFWRLQLNSFWCLHICVTVFTPACKNMSPHDAQQFPKMRQVVFVGINIAKLFESLFFSVCFPYSTQSYCESQYWWLWSMASAIRGHFSLVRAVIDM